MESKKYNILVNITKKKQTHRYREQISGYQWGEGEGVGQDRGKGSRGTTTKYKINKIQDVIRTGNIGNVL